MGQSSAAPIEEGGALDGLDVALERWGRMRAVGWVEGSIDHVRGLDPWAGFGMAI